MPDPASPVVVSVARRICVSLHRRCRWCALSTCLEREIQARVPGVTTGWTSTMCGVQGPPIALVLQHEPPERLRATLCAFFAVGSAVSIAALAITGMFGAAQVGLGLQLLPGVPLGLAVARPLARHIDRRRARFAVLAISALSALALLLR